MRIVEHNLILNDITYGESVPPFNKNFEEYMQMAHLFLNHKGKHLFESEILSRYSEGVTLETLFAGQPQRFIQGSNHDKDGIRQKTWYDIWGMDEIMHGDDFFDYFFICKLRHQSLLDIDAFLNFHLDYSFKDDKQAYFRFLQLSLRQYGDMLTEQVKTTVQEWMAATQTKGDDDQREGTDNEKDEKIKGRLAREAGDHLTCLSLNQTALLIEYMQQAGIILKGDYLNFTQAGKAFNLLTGYSAHSLRLQLGTKGLTENAIKHEDYKELHEVILKLASLIGSKTKPHK